MSPAEIDIQTLKIDTLNNNKSILFESLWISTCETIIFDGFLKIYNNIEEEETNNNKKIEIKKDTILNFDSIKVCQEYTKLPLRFNEAGLVKYLEKNGIGRPSTYASIINKVIERKYIEIKNIDGVEKDSKQIILNPDYKIKEDIRKVYIGREQTKLVSTNMGNQVNDFMCKYFEPILDIEFTSNFESYLDKIASGNANWVTVLRTFYDIFEPIVEKLNTQALAEKKRWKTN
jgi:DNA topoisomerase-1